MIRLSKKLRNAWLGNNVSDKSLKELLDGGILAIYGGSNIALPANVNAAETGTLLLLLTLNGGVFTPDIGAGSTNGLVFEPSTDSALGKPSAATWKGIAVGNGAPRYARFYDKAYNTGVDSGEDYNRIDLDVGYASGVVRLSNTNLYVSGVTEVYCSSLSLSLPDTI